MKKKQMKVRDRNIHFKKLFNFKCIRLCNQSRLIRMETWCIQHFEGQRHVEKLSDRIQYRK